MMQYIRNAFQSISVGRLNGNPNAVPDAMVES